MFGLHSSVKGAQRQAYAGDCIFISTRTATLQHERTAANVKKRYLEIWYWFKSKFLLSIFNT